MERGSGRGNIASRKWMMVLVILFLVLSAPLMSSLWERSLTGWEYISSLLSVVSLVILSISLSYVNSSCFHFSKDSSLLYGLYLAVILLNPESLHFSHYHAAALILPWSIYYLVGYISSEKPDPGSLFLSLMFLSTVALLVPQLVFFIPVYLYFSLSWGDLPFSKYLLTAAASLSLPWFILLSVLWIWAPASLEETLSGWWHSVASFTFHWERLSAFFLPVALFVVRSLVFVLKELDSRNRVQRHSIFISVWLSVAGILLMLCYTSVDLRDLGMLLMIPAIFPLFDYFTNGRKKETGAAFYLLLLSVVCYRIYTIVIL